MQLYRPFAAVAALAALISLGCSGSAPESDGADVIIATTDTTGGRSDLGLAPPDTTSPSSEAGDVHPDTHAAGPEPIAYAPCQSNDDCDSGWCVETADGRTCTRTCIDECPSGWTCAAAGGAGVDANFVCLPRYVNLCKPCLSDADCASPGDTGANRCIDYGPSGSFCGSDCSASGCPDGYACNDGQCRREGGICGCTWKAVKDAATTRCSATNEIGSCSGTRSCVTGALSTCDAATPVSESCNGSDDDCDGQTDEALELGSCSVTNDYGTCTGAQLCADGKLGCSARTPDLELCNGKDDDCDGLLDEGFPDSNADGSADCISTDDDADGVLDATDNCPSVPNSDQADLDQDKLGDACDGDRDGDGDPNDLDCAADNSVVGHKSLETCNGIDDNCSGAVDEGFGNLDGDGEADCVDADDDGDTVADATDNCPFTPNGTQSDQDTDGKGDACENDLDGDFDPDAADCAPQDAAIHHGAAEICDGVDQNCNGIVDEGSPDSDLDGVADCLDTDDDADGILDVGDNCPRDKNPDQLDFDGDGDGDVCDLDDDADGDPDVRDCATLDPSVHVGAVEICNGKDDDCNQVADEVGASGCTERLYDGDGDGYGLTGVVLCTCAAQFPYTATEGGDCSDVNAQVFPGATETCNGKDDDCDGFVDEVAASGCVDRFADDDSDGYGTTTACVCPGTPGYAPLGGDCAGADPTRNPGEKEACGDGVDQNCNGAVDEAGGEGCQLRFADKDTDGFGVSSDSKCLCEAAGIYTAAVGGDCNDNAGAVFPTNVEACDQLDNNCNGQVDEGVQTPFYKDNDSDGFGGATSKDACSAPPGYAADGGDCNDFNPDVSPGDPEVCDDIDDDCDGLVDEGLPLLSIYRDNDGDGFASKTAVASKKCSVPFGFTLPQDVNGDGAFDYDCDDSNVVAFPGAEELCDGADNDCDGTVDGQCPETCPGNWPYPISLPYHTPVRMIDLDGDAIDEIVVVDSSGKLWRIAPNGTGTAICPSLTFNAAYNGRLAFTVNPALGNWRLHLVQGTHLYDLSTCTEVKASANDANGFGVVGDFDGDGQLDYAGALAWPQICFKRAANWTSQCLTSPNSKVYDGAFNVVEYDDDGKDELVAVRGRTFPDATYYDGSIDIYGYNGTTMVLESTIAPAITGFVGTHIVSGQWADLENDGLTTRRMLFGSGLFDLKAGTKTGSLPLLDGTPFPQVGDLNLDGALEGAARGALVDLDGDGRPESIAAVGNEITIRTANSAKKALDGWPVLAGTFSWSIDVVVGDMNNDSRLDVISPSVDGAIYCHRLAPGTAGARNIYERGDFEWVNRTNARDPWEPSDTMARAWPLRFPTKEHRGYLTKGDVDYFKFDGIGGMLIQLTSPTGEDYDFKLTNQDGTVTYGTSTKPAGTLDALVLCVGCTQTPPPSYVLEVYPKNAATDYSAAQPYVLRLLKPP